MVNYGDSLEYFKNALVVIVKAAFGGFVDFESLIVWVRFQLFETPHKDSLLSCTM